MQMIVSKALFTLCLFTCAFPGANAETVFKDRFEAEFQDCEVCPEIVAVSSGAFTMGSPDQEPQSTSRERPQHIVDVPRFGIGKYEVTFDQWDACVAAGGCSTTPDDQGWGRGSRPVVGVSWNDAQEYAAWLSDKTGEQYRLPSEAEWEYATRAGSTGRFNTGDCITPDQANFRSDYPAEGCASANPLWRTLPIGSFEPNAFGLYDTHGNVRELVQDCWNSDYQGAPADGSAWQSGDCTRSPVRGGSWSDYGRILRSACRYHRPHRSTQNDYTGIRIARTMER